MSSYTIKSGDCLWNICKSKYKLTSNADILKKVKEVAAANNMNVNDTIFAGKTLQLVEAVDTDEVKDSKSTDPIKNQAQLAAAERIKNNNIQSYEDLNTLSSSSVSIFGSNVTTTEQKNQAYLDYSNELLLNYYDLNKDGTVTVDEFAQVEEKGALDAMNLQGQKIDDAARIAAEKDPSLLAVYDKDKDGHISVDEYQNGLKEMGLSTVNNPDLNKTIASRSANLFAQNLDFNGNGRIDAAELAFFNENADEMDGDKDGVIINAGESRMFGAVTGMNAGNQEFNRVVNKYLRGETLTSEEQQTLTACQNTIRTNMGKAAGINFEG